MELQLPRGMRDVPPAEKILQADVIALLRQIFEAYGFSPLETPLVERFEILAAKYAGGDEILKETFKLTDQGGRALGLRYDLTVPLARYIGMNPTLKRPFKRYQIGTAYRDGPIKKGRAREFYQCDVDTVGTRSMLADAECVNVAGDVFAKLGLDYEIHINNRKILNDLLKKAGLTGEATSDAMIALDKLSKLGRDGVCQEMIEKEIAPEAAGRALDLIQAEGDTLARLRAIEARVPASEGIVELRELFSYLDELSRIVFVPWLARGQAYYTGTIFEVYVRTSQSQITGSLAAGGRWDKLISTFLESKEEYPAVGISFGLEPILEELQARRSPSAEGVRRTVTKVYLIPIKTVVPAGRKIAQQLRRAGINTDMDLVGKGISDNLKYANAYGIPYVLIVGPDELSQGKVRLRDMRSGAEELLRVAAVIEKLRS
jgi:histidyl-tRNA synthetase